MVGVQGSLVVRGGRRQQGMVQGGEGDWPGEDGRSGMAA